MMFLMDIKDCLRTRGCSTADEKESGVQSILRIKRETYIISP